MKVSKISTVYFSPTYTTRKIIEQIAQEFNQHITPYDITLDAPSEDIVTKNELFIFGVPVYSGRVPIMAHQAISRFKGRRTPAIICCTYGNRDYEDALLELQDTVEANGFTVIAAGAFIARHSIFPQLATNRPDNNDMEIISKFASECKNILLTSDNLTGITNIKGNRPYREPSAKLPIFPSAEESCSRCGTCISLCPTQAIDQDNPTLTAPDKCIACGRCIVVCPLDARHFRSDLYNQINAKFVAAYTQRKEPEIFMQHILCQTDSL